MTLRLLFISSFLLGTLCQAQTLRFTQMRIGFDALHTASYLTPSRSIKDHIGNYRNWEGSFELIGPYKLSFLGEFGQTTLEVNIAENTLIYNSKGSYGRIGFNFDLTDTKKRYELDLGWRMGYSFMDESARVAFYGDYWNTVNNIQLPSRNSQFLFGQIVLDYKSKLFPKSKTFLKDIWLGVNLRIRLKSSSIGNQEYDTPLIAGYGLNFVPSFVPAIQSTLFYAIHFTKGTLHKSHHLNNNYDIVEKNHRYYKVKRHKVVADDTIRD
jgi:hypothetical protein